MGEESETASRVSVISGYDDNAVLVKVLCFQIIEKRAKRFVHLMDRVSNPVVEAGPVFPIAAVAFRPVIYTKLVDILRLRVKENRTILFFPRFQICFQLPKAGRDLKMVPQYPGIELDQVRIFGKDLLQDFIVADDHLVAIGLQQLFKAVDFVKWLQVMGMEEQSSRPDRRL